MKCNSAENLDRQFWNWSILNHWYSKSKPERTFTPFYKQSTINYLLALYGHLWTWTYLKSLTYSKNKPKMDFQPPLFINCQQLKLLSRPIWAFVGLNIFPIKFLCLSKLEYSRTGAEEETNWGGMTYFLLIPTSRGISADLGFVLSMERVWKVPEKHLNLLKNGEGIKLWRKWYRVSKNKFLFLPKPHSGFPSQTYRNSAVAMPTLKSSLAFSLNGNSELIRCSNWAKFGQVFFPGSQGSAA